MASGLGLLFVRIALGVGIWSVPVFALDIGPRPSMALRTGSVITLRPVRTTESLKYNNTRNGISSITGRYPHGENQGNGAIQRRADYREVTHGVGYATHLDPQYYQGNHMGKYYDCALQGPWKPIHGNYKSRSPEGTSDVMHNNHQHQQSGHHHENSGPNQHGGEGSSNNNYVDEWDQHLKQIIYAPHPHTEGDHYENSNTGPGHHEDGHASNQNTQGYGMTSAGNGGSGHGSYDGHEQHHQGHPGNHGEGHQRGVKGGQGSGSFHADFPHHLGIKDWHQWVHEDPYGGPPISDQGYRDPKEDEDEDGEQFDSLAFHEAVKNFGDGKYTHAIIGLFKHPGWKGEGGRQHQNGGNSQGYQPTGGEGEGSGTHHHSGGGSAGGKEPYEEEEKEAPQMMTSGEGGAHVPREEYPDEESNEEEDVEHSNPSEQQSSGPGVEGEGEEESSDMNGGHTPAHGDFNAQYVDGHNTQHYPVHENTANGYSGGQDSQVPIHPYSVGADGSAGAGYGEGAVNPQNQYAAGGLKEYNSPHPKCPYHHAHNHPHMTSAIPSRPYDEGPVSNHLQMMLPPQPQNPVETAPSYTPHQYEVHENQEESENQETTMGGHNRPEYNRPPISNNFHESDEQSSNVAYNQPSTAEGPLVAPNIGVDGSMNHPVEHGGGEDFLMPPPPIIMKGNGDYRIFMDGRRKRRPVGRPSSYVGRPVVGYIKRPLPFMMRSRQVVGGPIKRISFS